MKKIVFYTLILFLYSCDKGFYEERYITNRCNDSVNVKFVFINSPSKEFNVAAYNDYLLNSTDVIYGKHPKQFINKNIFENIIVTKGGVISKVDYVNHERWIFEEYEKEKFRSYLIINPDDFE